MSQFFINMHSILIPLVKDNFRMNINKNSKLEKKK